MAYTIKNNDCIQCDNCRTECPEEAVQVEAATYWIDPTVCDSCESLNDTPPCVNVCPVESTIPLEPKKGRCKSTLLPAANLDLFLNGKTSPFASSIVVWEASNLLAQRDLAVWQADADGVYYYQRAVYRGRGQLLFHLAEDPATDLTPMGAAAGRDAIATTDIRSACLNLLFAAYGLTLERPWQESFTLNDQQIEQYLGLDKRRDLTKLDKLTLIKDFVYQACRLLVTLEWPRQGRVQACTMDEHPVWQLLDTQYYFEADAQGCRHLIGLAFTVQPGLWSRHFLNRQDYRRQRAFYQYGTLPQSLLTEVMSHWQQHEGAMRLLLWLIFKLRLGGEQRMTVRTLLRVAYGETRVEQAITQRGGHKRLLRTFESDLETIYYYGLKPIFDPETYPPEIQPLWSRVADIPDDAEAALEFWTEDANLEQSLTDMAPRGKWQLLLNARLLGFELSDEWQQSVRRPPQRRKSAKTVVPDSHLSAPEIKSARKQLQISQRELASRMGKSQSWIRDVENGRFRINAKDQARLRQTLQLS